MNRGLLGLGRWSLTINRGEWKPRNFDVLIIELLQYALQGKVSKILLSLPSRHGKSTLISKNFVSYYLTHFPNESVILSSYEQKLASKFGKEVRETINEFGKLSPYNIRISQDTKAKNNFQVNKPYKGEMIAVGSGGALMGFGASLFIVDDPVKNVKDAESEVKQADLKDWFGATAKSRLQTRKNGKPPIIIVIAQRLDTMDLHGIIKTNEPHTPARNALAQLRSGAIIPEDVWVDFTLPAICEDPTDDLLGRKKGEVLWEKQRSFDWLMAEKRAMGSYLFNCIYQNSPKEREGNIIKREWLTDKNGKWNCIIDKTEVPTGTPILRYWDLAASQKKKRSKKRIETDKSSAMLGTDDGTYFYILDWKKGKWSAKKVLRRFKQVCEEDTNQIDIYIEQEPASQSKILIQNLQDEYPDYYIRPDKVSNSKRIRAFQLEALIEDRKFRIVKGEWNEDLLEELISFTGEEGGADDGVDCCTGLLNRFRRKIPEIIA